jgi:hypothetical protein
VRAVEMVVVAREAARVVEVKAVETEEAETVAATVVAATVVAEAMTEGVSMTYKYS